MTKKIEEKVAQCLQKIARCHKNTAIFRTLSQIGQQFRQIIQTNESTNVKNSPNWRYIIESGHAEPRVGSFEMMSAYQVNVEPQLKKIITFY